MINSIWTCWTELTERKRMIKHYITKYIENGTEYAESWLQINIFGYAFCFWRKKIKL